MNNESSVQIDFVKSYFFCCKVTRSVSRYLVYNSYLSIYLYVYPTHLFIVLFIVWNSDPGIHRAFCIL